MSKISDLITPHTCTPSTHHAWKRTPIWGTPSRTHQKSTCTHELSRWLGPLWTSPASSSKATPRVFAPAVSQESNDNKTIEYNRDHKLICRNCVEGRENAARDVLIAPGEHGIHWPHALTFHLVRYRHTHFRWMPPCRPGRHRAVYYRTK